MKNTNAFWPGWMVPTVTGRTSDGRRWIGTVHMIYTIPDTAPVPEGIKTQPASALEHVFRVNAPPADAAPVTRIDGKAGRAMLGGSEFARHYLVACEVAHPGLVWRLAALGAPNLAAAVGFVDGEAVACVMRRVRDASPPRAVAGRRRGHQPALPCLRREWQARGMRSVRGGWRGSLRGVRARERVPRMQRHRARRVLRRLRRIRLVARARGRGDGVTMAAPDYIKQPTRRRG